MYREVYTKIDYSKSGEASRVRVKSLLKYLERMSSVAEDNLINRIRDLRREDLKDFIYIKEDYYKVDITPYKAFRRIYGPLEAYFIVDTSNKVFELEKIEPADLLELYNELNYEIYKGYVCRNNKDKFKIDLYMSHASDKEQDNEAC